MIHDRIHWIIKSEENLHFEHEKSLLESNSAHSETQTFRKRRRKTHYRLEGALKTNETLLKV